MPRRAKELNNMQVKNLRHPGGKSPAKIPVGGVSGLYVQIQPNTEHKSWLLRARFGDWQERALADGTKQRGRAKREIGLGPYPEISLKLARERALEAKDKLARGLDPIAERRTARAAMMVAARRGITFADALKSYCENKTTEFSSEKYRKQWRTTVEKYAVPELGAMMVEDITTDDVLRVLQPIWNEKSVTASKLRQRIERILDHAAALERGKKPAPEWAQLSRWRNVATWKGNLSEILAKPSTVSNSENWPALQLKDAARWWQALQTREGMGAQALAFQAMTATRSGAIRFATWDEIDLAAKVWTIQPGRQASKIPENDTAKRIPLTDYMVALLEGLPRMKDSEFVFWAPRGGALSDATLGKCMRSIHEADQKAGGKGYVDAKTGEQAVPHGLRSTFRTWVAERTTYDGDLAEVALFHKVGSKVAQAYDRSEMVEKRRDMMTAWGGYLAGHEPAKVVQLQGARA